MKHHFTVPLLLILLLAGCRTEGTPAAGTDPSEKGESAGDVHVRVASWEEVEQEIAAQQGKVVVLDVWSTWCQPCVKEFPGLVALHQQYGGDRVACMSLNSNYAGGAGESPEDALEMIEEFLVKRKAAFQNFISTTPDFDLYRALDAGAVPIVRVYDKSGQLRKQFVEEGFTYETDIVPLVEELLAE